MSHNPDSYLNDSVRREELQRAEEILKKFRSKMSTSTTEHPSTSMTDNKPGMMRSLAHATHRTQNEVIQGEEKFKQGMTHSRPDVNSRDRSFQPEVSANMQSNRGFQEQNFQQPGFQQREFADNRFQQQDFVDSRFQQGEFDDNRFRPSRSRSRSSSPSSSSGYEEHGMRRSLTPEREGYDARGIDVGRIKPVVSDVNWGQPNQMNRGWEQPNQMNRDWEQPNRMNRTWDASHGQFGHEFTEKDRASDTTTTTTKKKGLGGLFAGLFKKKGETHDTRRSFDDNFMRREEPFEIVYANALVQRFGDGYSRGFLDEGFFVTLKVFRKSLFSRGLKDDSLSVIDFLRRKTIPLDDVIDSSTRTYLKGMLGLSPKDNIRLEMVDDPTLLLNTRPVHGEHITGGSYPGSRFSQGHFEKPSFKGGILGYGDFKGRGILQGRDPIATVLKGVAGEIEHTVTGRRDVENPDRPGHLFKRDGVYGPEEPDYGHGYAGDYRSKDVGRGEESYHKRGFKEKIHDTMAGIKEKVRRPKHEEHVNKRDEVLYRNDEYVRDTQHKRGIKEKIHDTMAGIKGKIRSSKHNEHGVEPREGQVYSGREDVYDKGITQEDKWKQEGRIADKGYTGSVPQYESTYAKPGQQLRDERVYGGEHDYREEKFGGERLYGGEHDYRGGNVRKEEKLYGGEHDYRREEPMVGHDQDYERGYGVDNRGKGVGSNFYDRGHRVYNNNDEPVRYQ